MRQTFFGAVMAVAFVCAAAAQQEIVLRPGVPAGEEWYTPEASNVPVKSAAEKWVRNVQRPVLEVYPVMRPNGTAVIIAPGGGFNILAIEHEGRDVARWFNLRGVTTQAPAEARPSFAMPIYTGLAGPYTVAPDAPPLFTAVAWDDSERMVETATSLAANWKKAKRPAELHVFSDGGHGFGMNVKGKASDQWTTLLESWMARMGWM